MDKRKEEPTIQLPSEHEFFPLRPPELRRLYVVQLGWHQCPRGWRCGPASRDYYLFHCVLSGSGELTRPGLRRRVTAGESFLLRPGDPTVYCADEHDPWSYCYFGLNGTAVEEYLCHTVWSSGTQVVTADGAGLLRAVEELRRRLYGAEHRGFLSEEGALRLLSFYVRPEEDGEGYRTAYRAENRYVHWVRDYVAAHYAESLTASGLAGQLHLNRSYLSELFSRTVGVPLKRYLQLTRLEQAQRLLLETRLPLTEVARRVGFESYSCFFRAFRDRLQVSPAQYRAGRTAAAHGAAEPVPGEGKMPGTESRPEEKPGVE